MGQRANLVLKDRNGWTLHYSHWAANRLDVDLFWGAEHALAFVSSQRRVDKTDWLDTIWCEGAAVVDTDARSILWFGGEEIIRDVPWRRTHLALMRAAWAPWEVHWADHGLLDVVESCALPASLVRPERQREFDQERIWDSSLNDADAVAAIIVKGQGRMDIFPSTGQSLDEDGFLGRGPAALTMLKDPRASFEFSRFPEGGIHLDLDQHTIRFWRAGTWEWLMERVRTAWQGWTIVNDGDRFESQLDLVGGRILLPRREPGEVLNAIVDRIRQAATRDKSGTEIWRGFGMERVLERLGVDAKVSPWTDAHYPVLIAQDRAERILQHAVEEVQREGFGHPPVSPRIDPSR